MKKTLYIIIAISFFSCENSYEISKKSLKCRFSLNHGFDLSELKVSEFNESGEPSRFEKVFSAYYIEKQKDLGDKNSYRTFYFKKANGEKGYEWNWRIDTSMVYYDTLPIKFKNSTWYQLDLSNDCHTDELFFKFSENRKTTQFHKTGNCSGPW